MTDLPQPESPLPWNLSDDSTYIQTASTNTLIVRGIYSDLAYLVHAANAYRGLVEENARLKTALNLAGVLLNAEER